MIRWVSGALLVAGMLTATAFASDFSRPKGPAGVIFNKASGVGVATAPGPAPAASDASVWPPASTKIFGNFAKAYRKGKYICCYGYRISGPSSAQAQQWLGIPFTPANSTTVKTIDVAVQYQSGTNAIAITLNADNGGIPGTVLGTFNVSNVPTFPTCCAVTTVTSASGIAVTGGHKYWVVVQTTGSSTNFTGIWNSNDINQISTQDGAVRTGTTWALTSFKPGLAFAVFSP